MSTVAEDVRQIRQAIYGREIREAIADGIEHCYSDVSGGVTTANTAADAANAAAQRANTAAAGAEGIPGTASLEDVNNLKSAFTYSVMDGSSVVDASYINTNSNTALVSNGDGSYTVGTTDYGTTTFGARMDFIPGYYYLYGVHSGIAYLSPDGLEGNAVARNTSPDPVIIYISEQTALRLGYRITSAPASSFKIVPFVKEALPISNRSKIDKMDESYSKIEESTVWPKNIIPASNFTAGKYLDNGGVEKDNASYRISDYFRVKPNTLYTNGNSASDFCFYDKEKKYISYVGTLNADATFTTPTNAKYARRSTNVSPTNWNISEGNILLPYTPYEPIKICGIDASKYALSPFYKGMLGITKNDLSDWYECECLKENLNPFGFSLGSDTAYTGTQYAEVLQKFDALMADAESGYITKRELGTASGTDSNGNAYKLYEYAFVPRQYQSNYAKKKHPKILIDCSIHGFEKNSTFGFYSLLYDVVHNWKKNAFLATLRKYVEIRIVPVVNPWGFDKNVRNNANGVNLNRNFPAENWSYVPSGKDSSGASPLDQPEAAVLAQWFQNNADMWFYINTHTNGHYFASGYEEANVLMPYTNIGDEYYNKMFNSFKKQIEAQTSELPTEFQNLSPAYSKFIGKIQGSATSGSGYADQYVCSYLKIALAMTLEGCNYLQTDEGTQIQFTDGTIKINAELFGNAILNLLAEYIEE